MSAEAIKQAVRAMTHLDIQTFWGEVEQVDKDNHEALVSDLKNPELKIPDVLLGLDAVVTIPKNKSQCLVGIIDNDPTQCYMIWVADIESIIIKSESLKINEQITLTDKGVKIENDSQNVGKLFRELCNEIKKIIVLQGTSPSIPAIEQIIENSKKVLV